MTDSNEFNSLIKKMRNLDFDNNKRFFHNNLYWNYRISGLQASLAKSQIKSIEKIIKYKIIGDKTGNKDGIIISLIAANVNKSTSLA